MVRKIIGWFVLGLFALAAGLTVLGAPAAGWAR